MDPDYGHQINPVSRLMQIMQARKEPEPQFQLVLEHGLSRYKEFVMEVCFSLNVSCIFLIWSLRLNYVVQVRCLSVTLFRNITAPARRKFRFVYSSLFLFSLSKAYLLVCLGHMLRRTAL